ncbi:hypothetical protein [Streptomyces pseudogriseolus]|uniref:hypothetical protein n=1 Tax=Streptomyces pseudogriseolus TaxID=36817 RepID=UPI00346CE271
MDDAALAERLNGRGLDVIVPSRLLGDLLEQIHQERAAHLALDFARHVLDLQRDEIEEPVSVACLEYMDAVHEAIGLGSAVPRLLEAEERLRAVAQRRTGNRFFLAGGADSPWTRRGSVPGRCWTGRTGEARSVTRPACSSPVSCRRRSAAGPRGTVTTMSTSVSPPVAPAGREARWQVRHIIASEPNPHGDA